MRRHDSYRGFASHYDRHGWDWYAAERGPRLADLVAQRGHQAARVLDAGCGTGSLALLLAGRGHAVTGVDLSEPMIDAARRKPGADAVDWHVADITRFEPPGAPFDIVTCVADTLNHLPSLDDWQQAFEHFAAALRPGGTLFVDAMTIRGLSRMDRIEVSEEDGRTLILVAVFESGARRSTLKVTSFVPAEEGGLYERASETITEWGQPVAGVFERLVRAGFDGATRVWTRTEDPEAADRMSIVATRR